MKAIVHIGAPKTGSSSIQAFLKMNTKALRKQGFRYGLDYTSQVQHVDVPIAALARIGQILKITEKGMRYGAPDLAAGQALLRKVTDDLAAYPTKHPNTTLILTAEHMLPWLTDDAAVKSLDEMLSAHFDQLTYVLYLRNPVDMVRSAFSERVKRGGSREQDEFVNLRLAKMDQFAAVQRWDGVIGRDRFKVRLLEADFLTDGDLIADFASVCGISLEGLEQPERMNEALSAEAVEVLTLFNRRVPQIIDVSTVNPVSRGVVRRIMAHPQSKTPIRLTAEQSAAIASATAESTEKLRATYFPNRKSLYSTTSRSGGSDDRADILARALEIAVDLFVDQRSGKWGEMDAEDIAKAKVNGPEPKPGAEPRAEKARPDKEKRKARRAAKRSDA